MWGIMTSLKHCGDLYFLLGILVEHFSFSIVWSKQEKLPWGRRGSVAFILNTLQKAQRKACLGNQWISAGRSSCFYHSKRRLAKSVMTCHSCWVRLLWLRIAREEQSILDVLRQAGHKVSHGRCRICNQAKLLEVAKAKVVLKSDVLSLGSFPSLWRPCYIPNV